MTIFRYMNVRYNVTFSLPLVEFLQSTVEYCSSDIEMEDIAEPEVKKLVMPTKSTRQEKITFRVSIRESKDV